MRGHGHVIRDVGRFGYVDTLDHGVYYLAPLIRPYGDHRKPGNVRYGRTDCGRRLTTRLLFNYPSGGSGIAGPPVPPGCTLSLIFVTRSTDSSDQSGTMREIKDGIFEYQ